MAETGQGTRRRASAAKDEQAEDRKPTERVVLKLERVIVLPEGCADETIKAAQEVIRKATRPDPRAAALVKTGWVEVARTEGDKRQAIEKYAGVPNTSTARPGTYKAPSVSAFAGGRAYEKPPEPKVEAKDIE